MVSFYIYKLSTSFTKLCGQDVGYDWESLVHNSYPGEATSAWRVTAVLSGECNLSGCYPWQPTGKIWLLSNIQQVVQQPFLGWKPWIRLAVRKDIFLWLWYNLVLQGGTLVMWYDRRWRVVGEWVDSCSHCFGSHCVFPGLRCLQYLIASSMSID